MRGSIRRLAPLQMADALFPDDDAESSVPPSVAPEQLDATAIRTHPLWQRAAGRGGSGGCSGRSGRSPSRGGRGRGSGGHDGERPAFEPLSVRSLEFESFRPNADGESTLMSDSGSASIPSWCKNKDGDTVTGGRAGNGKRPIASGGEDEGEEATPSDSELFGEGPLEGSTVSDADATPYRARSKSGRDEHGKRAKKQTAHDAQDAMLSNVAFGGGHDDSASDVDSLPSGISSQRKRDAYKNVFPVKDVYCIGCVLANKLRSVDDFVRENITKMSDDHLWKMAALVYVRSVQEPRNREGVCTPDWPWKDLRSHYMLHVSDSRVQRPVALIQLQTARHAMFQRIMRVEEGGVREVDRATLEELRKSIKLESDERLRFDALVRGDAGTTGRGRATGGGGNATDDV